MKHKCVNRIVHKHGSHGCPNEGVMCGLDGRWRCRRCNLDTYPAKVVIVRQEPAAAAVRIAQ